MDTMAEIAPKFVLPNRSAVTVGLAILPIPADPPWRHTNRQRMIVAVPAKARLTLASDRPIKEHMEIKNGKNISKVKNYLFDTDMFIACHYWDPKFPKLFSPKQINEFKNLKIIGDVTCDINGSVPTTIRSTSISKPYYSINTDSMKEIELGNKGIAVMAVDNLPSELPRDASEEFGDSVISEILPYLIDKDDGRINRATTASNGKFCENFAYLNDFIN